MTNSMHRIKATRQAEGNTHQLRRGEGDRDFAMV
jgi:hypothetical protein